MGIVEATDRSNSPLIIRVPTPRDTIPKSGASFAIAPRFARLKKLWSTEKIPKITSKIINTTNVNDAL
jgi:hypothetical protein